MATGGAGTAGRRIVVGALALVTALGAAACASKSSGGSSSAGSSGDTYHIPAILSITGTASFLGTQERNALLALQRQVNATGGIKGKKLKFDIQDNQSSPSVAVSLASKVISRSPVMITGSVTSTDRPVDNLVTSNGPVIYDLSPGDHPDRGGFVFSASASTASQTAAFVNFAKAKGWTRVAAITSTDASGQDGWEGIEKNAKASGGAVSVTEHETFAPTDVSVTSQLAKIKSTKPDAVFVWSTGTPVSSVFKGMQQLGMSEMPTMTTNGNAAYAAMQKLASILPQQLFFPGGAFQFDLSQLSGTQKQVVGTFDGAMKKQGSVVPDEGNALAWDPGLILVSALRKLGPDASAQQLKDYLNKLTGFTGIVGTYDFVNPQVAPDNRGVGTDAVLISRWDATKKRWVGVSGPGGRSLRAGS
jgi:branched-chain amino acid transport system substrate-binding protein